MASSAVLAWLDRLAWTFLYAGLLTLVLGIATHHEHLVAGWSLGVIGGVLAAAGVVLIGVRSRLRENPPGGAQSQPRSDRSPP
jgi:vacuolar-type H+-ATPase subunit I/STV1